MSKPTLQTAIIELIRERGPMSASDLGSELKAAGVTTAKKPTSAANRALNDGPFFRGPDGRWSYLVDLLDGVVLTTRVTDDERRDSRLLLDVDVAPLAEFPVMLTDGRPLDLRWDGARYLTGPEGWLDPSARNGLTAFRLVNGEIELAPVDDADLTDGRMIARRLTEQLRSFDLGFDDFLPGVPIAFAVARLRLEAPSALRVPTQPLSGLLEAEGLELHGDLVGLPGTDWAGWDELDEGSLDEDDEDPFGGEVTQPHVLDSIAAAFGLDVRSQVAFVRIVEDARDWIALDRSAASDAATDFWLPGVAEALAANGDDVVRRYAELVADLTTPTLGAAARYVHAALTEMTGEDLDAEPLLDAALAGDPTFGPALFMAARYAEDRGDARRTADLLRRAHVPHGDPQLARVRPFTEAPRGGPSRNAPCPCGSGRKYKLCCLAKAAHPLADRSRWLLGKVAQWALEPSQRMALLPYGLAIYGESIEAITNSLNEGLVHGLALFEGGLLEDYLDRRGALLPPDERDLATQWLTSRVRCYDVVAVRPGVGLTLRDVRDNSEHAVADRTASSQLRGGETICARLISTGEASEMFAFLFAVPPHQLGWLLRTLDGDLGDGLALAEGVGTMRKPPTVTTTEGEEMVVRTATYRLRDPLATLDRLGKDLTDHGDGVFTYDGERGVVRGFVRVEGDQLTVETNSAERFARLERIVRAAAPDAVRLSSERHTLADIAAEGPRTPLDEMAEQPPEVRAALEEYMREMERRWVDEQVPALDGRTPREAAADAKLRPRLLALLEDFELAGARAAPGSTYDVGRLRALLSL